MKKLPRRDRMKIYGDLLFIMHDEAKTGKVVLTRVQVRMNVPFDRLKTYLNELGELGLIEQDPAFKLTGKGRQYLREYKMVLDFMKRMGLAYK